MRFVRGTLLLLIALIPLASLFHLDEYRHWDTQHSAMAGPDEFSYLLMAQNFLRGGGLSLQSNLGLDTFYPPGYPLLVALWTRLFWHGQLTAFAAHTLNTALLCAAVIVVYFFSRRILRALAQSGHRRFSYGKESIDWLALVIAAIFATSWHVLETSLLLMSEPAFMLATFAWLAVALKWPAWYRSVPLSLLPASLATAAWAIRGAGIVCVMATILYPLAMLAAQAWRRRNKRLALPLLRGSVPILLTLVIPLVYQLILIHYSPEKSLASGEDSNNSYTRQLIHGINDNNNLHFTRPADYPAIAANLGRMMLGHFNDYAASFVPWPRENPHFLFRDVAGKVLGFFGLLGFLYHLAPRLARARPAPRAFPVMADTPAPTVAPPSTLAATPAASLSFVKLYILLYFALYLIWPFNFARFWSPVLPLMLAFAADALVRFVELPRAWPRTAAAFAILTLLLALASEEAVLQLGNYARRLNYVSDSLASVAGTIVHAAPDPKDALVGVMGSDELFALGWYLSQSAPNHAIAGGYELRPPARSDPHRAGRPERVDDMLIRTLADVRATPGRKLFFFSYFPDKDADTRDTIVSLKQKSHGTTLRMVDRKEDVVALWEITTP